MESEKKHVLNLFSYLIALRNIAKLVFSIYNPHKSILEVY